MTTYERLARATSGIDAPFACVDLDAYAANEDDLLRRAGGMPIRVASKSIRCRTLLTSTLARPGFAGVLAFTLPEALWLASEGLDDLVVGYPTVDRSALRTLASDAEAAKKVTLMVDDVAQLDLVDRLVAPSSPDRAEVRVAIDLDTSWQPLRGGKIRVGAWRSPLHGPAQAAQFARAIGARPGFRLVGMMAYEAQIAGVGDRPASRARGLAIQVMQALSARELAGRRRRIVEAVRAVAPDLEFVNGGGTGSLERTSREAPYVTEAAAGSGLYGPTLFDTYRAFSPRPAAFFALPVVRRPSPEIATVLGGGYHASGAAGADRLPRPALPEGLELDPLEGAGEVQTPLHGEAARSLRVGDVVFFRHAKAGELCERFDTLHLVRGDEVVDAVPTYRGEGRTFL